MLVDIINEWDKEVDGDLARYLSEDKQYPAWICRGIVAGYKAWRMETRRLNRVEHVKDAKGNAIEREAMHGWYEKHFPHGLYNCGFTEFSRLLDEDPT